MSGRQVANQLTFAFARAFRLRCASGCGPIWGEKRRAGFAGQQVGVRQVSERVWLVTFMHYDLGYFDDETCRLEPIENPFGPTVLPMSPE
jgi:hypothetical protein